MKKTLRKLKPVIPPKPTAPKKAAQRGQWVHKPIRSIIFVCVCGNKYVETREEQTTCIMCIQNGLE